MGCRMYITFRPRAAPIPRPLALDPSWRPIVVRSQLNIHAPSPPLMRNLLLLLLIMAALPSVARSQSESRQWVTYEPAEGPGEGKHIVFVSGDEEYRSEEGLPMLAKILAYRHGFKATVLFALDPETSEIDPVQIRSIPGLEQLEEADLLFIFIRWRDLPADQVGYIAEFTNSGKPIIGLRTSTHAFAFAETDPPHPYWRYDWRSEVPGWEGGWGRQVLGETWIDHHGEHGEEGTRGLVNDAYAGDPILNGVGDNVYGPTDVYSLTTLPDDAEVLLYGQTLRGLDPDAPPNFNKSIVPIAWRRLYTGETGNTSRVFATTMGAAVDLESEGLRRLLVNAVYWGLEMEGRIPDVADVRYVGAFEPSYFGFGQHRKGVFPQDLRTSPEP